MKDTISNAVTPGILFDMHYGRGFLPNSEEVLCYRRAVDTEGREAPTIVCETWVYLLNKTKVTKSKSLFFEFVILVVT